VFIRVNISPGPENEATLFVSFTKPCKYFPFTLNLDYPEYVFYNQTSFNLRVQHNPSKTERYHQHLLTRRNETYELRPRSREAIILNPNSKDEDFLLIEVLDDLRITVLYRFRYEIDSLKFLFPEEPGTLVSSIKSDLSHTVQDQDQAIGQLEVHSLDDPAAKVGSEGEKSAGWQARGG